MADDSELVRRVLAGDTQAYRSIVERHQARILYVGLKFLHNYEDAQDFTQEAFLRAYEKLPLYGGTGSFAAWLYRLAFNLAVNSYRGAREMLATDPLDEEGLPDPGRPMEDALLSGESSERVGRALEALPARYAIIVKMHYFDGLSYPDISDILDMPVNTVKSDIFRAKHIIKTRLARYMEE